MSVADRLRRQSPSGLSSRRPWWGDHTDGREPIPTVALLAVLATLAWVFVVLAAVADLLTTAYGLEIGAREANPAGRYLILEYGFHAAGLLKLVAIAITAVASVGIYAFERRYRAGTPVWWIYYPALVAPIWMGAAAWTLYQVLEVVA